MKTRLILVTVGLCIAPVGPAYAQAVLQFTATSYSVDEAAEAVTLTVQRSRDVSGEVGVEYTTADGTAKAEVKYTPVARGLTFRAGQSQQAIVVPIRNDGFADGTQDFKVLLSNPTGGAVLGTRTNATVLIADNDAGIQWRLADRSVVEEAGTVKIGVVRGDDGNLPVTVDVATSEDTATEGEDYTAVRTNVAFAPTEWTKFLSVRLLNDSLKEPNETFRLNLSNPTGATLGDTRTTTVTIKDNDQGFQFESSSYTVAEDAGVVLIGVLRGTDATDSLSTVDYAANDVTATNGLDYAANRRPLTLSFAPGEKFKCIAVPILNDGVREGVENFRVTLTEPSEGSVLGSRTNISVAIHDNDAGVGFELTSQWVWERAGAITLVIVRGNDGDLGPFSVDYVTREDTAKAGEDYQAVAGTLRFEACQTVQSLTIAIVPDGVAEEREQFQVILEKPTGGAVLENASTSVTILDSVCTVTPPFNSQLAIRREEGVNRLIWAGGGKLQRADRVTGPWQTLASARSPFNAESPVPVTFYRVQPRRPATLYVPSTYDGHAPMPLVLLLHEGTGTGAGEESDMRFTPLAEARGFLYCYPDSENNCSGTHLWNPFDEATDWNVEKGCPYVDDMGYLRGLIGEIGRRFLVDPKRVFVVGHSGGGTMTCEMARSMAELIAGIASLAAQPFSYCYPRVPSEPVNVLHINGTVDKGDPYWGFTPTIARGFWCNIPPIPGAVRAIQIWASYYGAQDPVTDSAPTMDLDLDVPGRDTVVTRYTRYPPGGAVELWTIVGGGHQPKFSAEFPVRVIDWHPFHSAERWLWHSPPMPCTC